MLLLKLIKSPLVLAGPVGLGGLLFLGLLGPRLFYIVFPLSSGVCIVPRQPNEIKSIQMMPQAERGLGARVFRMVKEGRNEVELVRNFFPFSWPDQRLLVESPRPSSSLSQRSDLLRLMKAFPGAPLLAAAAWWLLLAASALAIENGVQKPAGAKLRPGQYTWNPEVSLTGVVGIIVDLRRQVLWVYRGGILIARSTVSTGRSGHLTPPGVYMILTKNVTYHSAMYHEASMPFMERLTWDGMAIHAGNNPGFPASHGCIRVPLDFAEKLYRITEPGDTVLICDLALPPGEVVNVGLLPHVSPMPPPDPKSIVDPPRSGPPPLDVTPFATPLPLPTPAPVPTPTPAPLPTPTPGPVVTPMPSGSP